MLTKHLIKLSAVLLGLLFLASVFALPQGDEIDVNENPVFTGPRGFPGESEYPLDILLEGAGAAD